jgi:predicted small secreted protein
MDKREAALRRKKNVPAYLLLATLLFSSGCGTAGGAYATIQDIGKGISQDARSAYSFIQTADRWMRKNLW